MPDSNHIYITYFDRFIIQKSVDGGKSFEKIVVSDSIASVNNLVMYDSLFGFALYKNLVFITYEREKIFNEGYSGIIATEFSKNGDEIGMWRIKQMIKLNKAEFLSELGDEIEIYNNIKYSKNKFIFKFNIITSTNL